MGWEKKWTLTDSFRSWVPMSFWRKEVRKFCRLSRSWSFPLRVMIHLKTCVFYGLFFQVALNTRDDDIIAIILKVLQKLVRSGEMIGEALVPYYRQILPIFNIYKNKNLIIGDKIEYGQRKKNVLGDLIQETLELFELTGGEVIICLLFFFGGVFWE